MAQDVDAVDALSGVRAGVFEFGIKPFDQGAYVGKHLSFVLNRKVLRGDAIAAKRTREIRPSGVRGGLAETLAMVELGTHCTS